MNLTTMKVKELRELAGEKGVIGRWDMKKDSLIKAIEEKIKEEELNQVNEDQPIVQETETSTYDEETAVPQRKGGGRAKMVEVYKDGELIKTIKGLLNTFAWAKENEVCNQGWVKNSLKTGKETTAGRKFKEGGYLFKYAE